MAKIQEYKTQTDSIFRIASRKSINKYKRLQSTAKLVGAFTGLLALLTSKIMPVFEKLIQNDTQFPLACTVIAFFSGAYYLMLNTKIEQTKDLLEDFKESLDDKSYYYAIINSIIGTSPELEKVFSKIKFEHILRDWKNNLHLVDDYDSSFIILRDDQNIPKVIDIIGISDFTKLVISKGLEKGLIQEINIVENNFPTIGYSFQINKAHSA